MADTQNTKALERVNDDGFDEMVALPTKVQRFIHLYLTGQYTQTKLAQLLEVHPGTVSTWMRRGWYYVNKKYNLNRNKSSLCRFFQCFF